MSTAEIRQINQYLSVSAYTNALLSPSCSTDSLKKIKRIQQANLSVGQRARGEGSVRNRNQGDDSDELPKLNIDCSKK